MLGEKDSRDIDITDPDAYFAYTCASTSPTTTRYILKTDLARMMKGKIPTFDRYEGGAAYYNNTDGKFGGTGSSTYFFRSKEIQEYVANDEEYVKRAIKEGITWFLPKEIQDIFVF